MWQEAVVVFRYCLCSSLEELRRIVKCVCTSGSRVKILTWHLLIADVLSLEALC